MKKFKTVARVLLIFIMILEIYIGNSDKAVGLSLYGTKDGKEVSIPKVSSKIIKYDNDNIEIDIKIPVVKEIKNKDIESKVNSVLEKKAIDFKKDVELLSKEYLEDAKKQQLEPKKFTANSDYQVTYNYGNILSVPVVYYQYTGGAHGMYSKKTYNVDLNTGKELTLKEFFKEGFEYKKIINKLIKEEISREPQKYFEETFKTIGEIQDYYITEDGIVVYFQLYEVAPYSSGIPEFKIPYKAIESGLKYKIKK